MRIIIINESVIAGGAEIQAAREKKYFTDKGHEVALLTFDPAYPINTKLNEDSTYNIPVKFSNIEKAYHRLFRSKHYAALIRAVFDDFHPEYVHINHTKHLPLDVFSIVKDYPCVQTLRDYSFICPKETCIKDDGTTCSGYKSGGCLKCLGSRKDGYFKYFNMSRLNRKRKEAVNIMVAPSQALADACTENDLKTECLNNPFDFTILKKKEATPGSKVFLYYGKISEEKGVIQLLEAFEEFFHYSPEAELWMIGGIPESFQGVFEGKIAGKSYIRYMGLMTNTEIMELYKQIYCVIVPSLWIENYPNTVLEALASKTLVLGSNRGGIPELVGNKELLFDVLSKKDIIKKLIYANNLDKTTYLAIVKDRYEYVLNNNSQELYYERLCKIYESIS